MAYDSFAHDGLKVCFGVMVPGVAPLALEFNPFRDVEPNTDTRFSPFRVEGLIINLASLRFVLLVALGLLLFGRCFQSSFFRFTLAVSWL